MTVVHKASDQFAQGEGARTSVDQSHIVDAERWLQSRHLIELIEYNVWVGIALQANHDAHSLIVALIVYIGNAVNLLFIYKIGYILDKLGTVYIIRKLGYDNVLVIGLRLNFSLCTNHDSSTTCFKSLLNTVISVYRTAGGEIGSLDVVHKPLNWKFGVVDQRHCRIQWLGKIVRRHVGSHTYGDTRCSVYEQVGDTCRKHCRLKSWIVIVWLKIDRFRIYVTQHLFAYALESYLGVTHCGRSVTVDGTEVSMTIDQSITHSPILSHSHNRTVYRWVAVRVIFTHNLTYTVGRLLMRMIRCVTHLVHSI